MRSHDRTANRLRSAGYGKAGELPDGETVRTSCLITTAANAIVVPIHDRMLVIFKLVDGSAWLGETGGDPTELLWLAP